MYFIFILIHLFFENLCRTVTPDAVYIMRLMQCCYLTYCASDRCFCVQILMSSSRVNAVLLFDLLHK